MSGCLATNALHTKALEHLADLMQAITLETRKLKSQDCCVQNIAGVHIACVWDTIQCVHKPRYSPRACLTTVACSPTYLFLGQAMNSIQADLSLSSDNESAAQ